MEVQFFEIPKLLPDDNALSLNDIKDSHKIGELFQELPDMSALRIVCTDLRSERNYQNMWKVCAEATASLIFYRKSENNILFKPWLFAAHGPWQPKTRIVRYKKIWNFLVENYGLNAVRRSKEIEFESREGLRYAVFCELDENSFTAGTRVLLNRSSAIILSSKNELTSEQYIRDFFLTAFPMHKKSADSMISWIDIMRKYCGDGNLVIRPIGSFEEREHSFYLIGLKSKLKPFKLAHIKWEVSSP